MVETALLPGVVAVVIWVRLVPAMLCGVAKLLAAALCKRPSSVPAAPSEAACTMNIARRNLLMSLPAEATDVLFTDCELRTSATLRPCVNCSSANGMESPEIRGQGVRDPRSEVRGHSSEVS